MDKLGNPSIVGTNHQMNVIGHDDIGEQFEGMVAPEFNQCLKELLTQFFPQEQAEASMGACGNELQVRRKFWSRCALHFSAAGAEHRFQAVLCFLRAAFYPSLEEALGARFLGKQVQGNRGFAYPVIGREA